MPHDLDQQPYRVKQGERLRLHDLPADATATLGRAEAEQQLSGLDTELTALQELLYGAASHRVLIVLQGMDTSGKDGAIRRAFSWLNPQGVRVTSFRAPTQEEAAHDFLWRVHNVTPGRGFFAIFNRSHYEDVLVQRVRRLVPKQVWEARYEQINDFERLLTDTGAIVLKFFLHISKREQQKRLLDRERESDKAWKLSVDDWEDRSLWDEYERAYEDVFARCSTDSAPWFIVPADHKWFRDLAIASAVVESLRPYRTDWEAILTEKGKARLAELRQYRSQHPQ